jgi:hypothetical protein
MKTRRQFLARSLAALAAAPLIAKAAFAAKQPPNTALPGTAADSQSPLPIRVEGLAIKVPSNREHIAWINPDGTEGRDISYVGPWDGTFKLEQRCTNPAYILADLYEQSGTKPDWALAARFVEPVTGKDYSSLFAPALNWRMLYDWGRHCDETVVHLGDFYYPEGALYPVSRSGPRFTVNTVCHTSEEMDLLREDLRMHCLNWQSTDPRYRTSWPGVAYPKGPA